MSKTKGKIGTIAIISIAALFLVFVLGYHFGEKSRTLVVPLAQEALVDEALPEPVEPVVNINTATAEELTALPGVGEKLAADIIALREKYGPFHGADDLFAISGIGESKLEQMRPHIVTE